MHNSNDNVGGVHLTCGHRHSAKFYSKLITNPLYFILVKIQWKCFPPFVQPLGTHQSPSLPFPHRAWTDIHLCSLSLFINEVLYVLKTVNKVKSSCEMHLQLASTFPVGSSGLGVCYHVSPPVLRQPSNSTEISYKGNQDDQWEFCQEHQSLLNGSVLRTANTQTCRKEDSSENDTVKVKKN